jgi:hypothetical protein
MGQLAAIVGSSSKDWSLRINNNNASSLAASDKPQCATILPNSRVWVALDRGELIDMDLASGRVLERRMAHSSPVSHILIPVQQDTLNSSVWTIDENGSVKIWTAANNNMSISLSSVPRCR